MNQKHVRFARQLVGTEYDGRYRQNVIDGILRGVHVLREQSPRFDTPTSRRQARPGEKVTPSVCFSCQSTCEVLIYSDVSTGKILRVEGDPDSPQTQGALCVKGLASKDLCYNPERLKKPLKRVGKRGEGKFEEISWNEALDTVAAKLLHYKKECGPQGIAMLEGTRRGWSRVYTRLCNLLHTPNNGAAGWAQCLWPRLIDCNLTFGGGAQYMEAHDYPNTRCILAWGVNPATSWGVRAVDIMDARGRGAALIAVDPYCSETAAKADIWLQIRPDTDMALALGLLHVIIDEDLIDKKFIEDWTFGYDSIVQEVKNHTPQWAAEITGVDPELIATAARVYAKAEGACLIRGLSLDQVHDSVQVCRATAIIAAITGNIGRPGGNVVCSGRGEISQNTHEFICAADMPEELERLRCGYDDYPLLTQKLSPVPTAHMPTLWETMRTGTPYPIKCAVIFGSNALVSYTNTTAVREALEQVEFLAVSDLFLTPTGRMADIVFPASSWLERNNVISSFQSDRTHTLFQRKAEQIGESRNDVDIIIDLAKRLGLEERFWKNSDALYDYLLSPTGLTFKEAAAKRRLFAPQTYENYKEKGFKTPSGKIELYSQLAERCGCDPVPRYTPSFQSPGSPLHLLEKYPFIITTGRHESAFRISENRINPWLLELSPKAWLDINANTAKRLGIRDGDRVLVESTAGKAYAFARLTLGLREDVVQAISGWPEEDNINLTVPWGDYAQGVGSVCARGYLCDVRLASDADAMEGGERR